VTGRWVIVAPNRAGRPQDFGAVGSGEPGEVCPFCEGNEGETTSEVLARREPSTSRNGRGWRVRVIPNKYPALHPDLHDPGPRGGFYESYAGGGVHDVIVESPRHVCRTTELTPQELQDVLECYRERLLDLRRDPRLVYGMVFKNVGAAAGASLEHAHSQLIALPIMPINIQDMLVGSQDRFVTSGQCVYCRILAEDRTAADRLVDETDRFIAICPFASRFPFETWLLPRAHASHYEDHGAEELAELAVLLRRVMERIDRVLGAPAYHYILHTAPLHDPPLPHFHWHLSIMPRTTGVAGFEWGSGFYINVVSPETAAEKLRTVRLPADSQLDVSRSAHKSAQATT
jgi:UDPglucose--hexose-1-phosphate uridylyltransferase